MAQYTPKRKYTKKPTASKKIVKKIVKKEVIVPETTQVVTEETISKPPAAKLSVWQKIKETFKKWIDNITVENVV